MNDFAIAAIAAVAAVALLVAAWLIDRRRRIYADLSTTPAAAVSAGRNEVKGRAWAAEPLDSHLTDTASIVWRYELEEEREHTRTVTATDSKGKTTTRTETYYEWHTIDDKSGTLVAFQVVDDSGAVTVVPSEARLSMREFGRNEWRKEDNRGFLQKMFSADSATGKYRETESGIAAGDELFVVGEASLPDGTLEPHLDHGSPFLISTRSEESHRGRLGWFVPVLVVAAFGAGVVSGGRLWQGPGLALGALAVGLLFSVGASVIVYNRLQLLQQQAARSWSLIGIQLTRRHDLIPRLAAIAEGAAAYERSVHQQVTTARTAAMSIADAEEEVRAQRLELTQLMGLIEANPILYADATFTKVRTELADTENRIAAARIFYNDTVTLLRERSQTYPGVLIARFAVPHSFELFAADGFERTVPKPEFDF